MKRRSIFVGLGLALALLTLVGGWYVQRVNRSHPAAWPMLFGEATGSAAIQGSFPEQYRILWSHPVQPVTSFPPVIDADGNLYVPSGDQLLALGPDGTKRWAWKGREPIRMLALGRHGEIYAVQSESLTALSADGQMRWTYSLPDTRWLAPLLVGPGGVIYVVAEYEIQALSSTGELKWSHPWNPRNSSWPVLTRGGLLVMAEKADLLALRPDGQLAWVLSFPDKWSHSMNLAVDQADRIYVRGPDQLKIFDHKGKRLAEGAARPTPAANLAVGEGYVQDGLLRWRPDGSREEWSQAAPLAEGIFTYLDQQGRVLLIDRPNRGVEYALLSPTGEELWRLKEFQTYGLPALDAKGQICFVGVPPGESEAALLCLGQ